MSESRTFYRGVAVEDKNILLTTPHIPNVRLQNQTRNPYDRFHHEGIFYTVSEDGPKQTAYQDAKDAKAKGRDEQTPLVLRLILNKGNFPLIRGRVHKPSETDEVEFRFDPVQSFDDLGSTCTLNLDGLSDKELRELGFSVSIGDADKELKQAFPEFEPYEAVKRELQMERGENTTEDNISRI